MHRCGSGFLVTSGITFVLILLLALTGCLGKSSAAAAGGVSSVTLSPGGTLSIDVGGTQVFSAAAKNAEGKPILGLDIQFVVTSGTPNAPAPLSVASNGNACAGTWDASVSQCNPGTTGIAYVQAVTNGVYSAQTTVYIHQHVDNIQIVQTENPPPQYQCFYQGQTWDFEGIAYSGNPPVDISNTVGPLTWSSNNAGVVTTAPLVNPQQPTVLNQMQATAASPGITQIFASVAGTTSAPYPFTTCLIRAIYLQIASQGQQGNSILVDNGASIPVNAAAIDTLYGVAPGDDLPLSKPPLTWSTTNPEVAAFATTTNTTAANSATARNNLGGATLTASCAPPSCNIGVLPGLPIYASNGILPNGTMGFGAVSVDVTSTSAVPTYTAWAATTDCQNQPGCDSALFSVTSTITSGKNPIGAIASLPRTPNSMVFDHQASGKLYIGTDQGLMFVTVGPSPGVSEVSISPTPCNVSLCGKVLAVSNDGKLVVVSDTVSTPSQVYIYSSTSGVAPIDLVLPNSGEVATAAAFSPDQLKIFIITNLGNLWVYSTVDPLASVPVATSATDVVFSADGSFAYVAGAPADAVSAYSTCSLPGTATVNIGSVTTANPPLEIFPSPVLPPPFAAPYNNETFFWSTQNILALEVPPAGSGDSTSLQMLTAEFAQNPILYPPPPEPLQLTCNPPLILPTTGFTAAPPVSLGEGNFTPIFAQLLNDGQEMIVLGQNIPAVLIYNVGNQTTTSITLSGSPATGCPQCSGDSFPLAAAASTDGSQVFVAACDQYNGPTCTAGSVHLINTVSGGDFQQVPYANINEDNNPNMCNAQGVGAPLCLPNMIAIAPQ
ncbi:MAG: hypothetical protein WCF61_07185 [Terriglobales bacterium]